MKRLALLLACLLSWSVLADDRVSLVVSDTRLVVLVRLAFGEIAPVPFVLAPEVLEATERFTMDLREVSRQSVIAAVTDLAKNAGFDVVRKGGVVWVGKSKEVEDDLIVYRPRFRSARYLADVVQSVTAAKSVLARSIKSREGMASPAGQSPRPGLNNAPAPVVQSSPSSVEGQIDRSEVDQIAFRVSPKDAGKVKTLLVQLDTPSGEVLLKAAVYEVGFDKREGSAVQIAATTPEIRQDTIELTLQQELSNFVVTKTGVNGSPTLIKRSVNTKLGLSPGEVVVLAGLQDDQADESTNRLPFLGWLLGQERQQKQSEILLFIEVVRI